MQIAFSLSLCLVLVGCAPPSITKQEYDQKCQETVYVHGMTVGIVYYKGSKQGFDYFHFKQEGATGEDARVKEGEVALKRRFPYSRDRKNWVSACPDWSGGPNIVIQPGATNTKF